MLKILEIKAQFHSSNTHDELTDKQETLSLGSHLSVIEKTHYLFKIEKNRSKKFFVSPNSPAQLHAVSAHSVRNQKSKNFEFELSSFLKTHNIYLTINSVENEFIWKKDCNQFEQPQLMSWKRKLKKETFLRERVCTKVSPKILTHSCSPSILFYLWFIDCSFQLCSISIQ